MKLNGFFGFRFLEKDRNCVSFTKWIWVAFGKDEQTGALHTEPAEYARGISVLISHYMDVLMSSFVILGNHIFLPFFVPIKIFF